MITVIAGSRDGPTVEDVRDAVQWCGWTPTVVVSGTARGGDQAGERWAALNGVPLVRMPAAWIGPDGAHDRAAGRKRNRTMAECSQALIALWDGRSPGTKHMIGVALELGLRVYVWKPRSAR